MKTTVKKWGINGEGIAFHEGKPVFIENAIPDEVIEFDIKSDEGTYLVGELTRLVEQSSKRRYPLCPIWKECGGCALMHVKYPAQCKMKEGNLKETLIKYADYNGRILPIIKNPEPLSYRNSCKLPFGEEYGELYTGMYERDTNHFQKMERCYVHSKLLEQTRQEVLKIMNEHHLKMYDDKKKTGYRTLVMKEFDSKIQIIFVTGKEDISEEFIHDVTQLEGVVSIWQSVKTETKREVFGDMRFIWGEEKMHLQLEDIQLSLLPRSFFQLNTKQSVNLYNVVKDWMPRSKTTVEAYSGIGAISLFVKDKAEEIIGVESIQDAVDNANENAMLNHADNVSFICEDAGSALAHLVQEKEVDTLIVDPPRSGLDDIMKETILKSKIKTMIYVSCNPATLAKDLGVLKKEYRIVKIQPVDMFSQTPHVETVVLLSHKKPDGHINVNVEFGEGEGKVPLDNIAKRAEEYKPKERVTYKMIKEYIEAKYGFKVHTAYIAEVKRDLGLPMYDAPNAVEELKQPRKHPTAEKVEAIKDALKHFEVI